MLFNKSKPIEYPIAVNPGQVMVVEFSSKGSSVGHGVGHGGYNIKVDLYVHYLIDRRGRSTNVANSGIVVVGGDGVHTVKLRAPQFNVTDVVKSVVYITTDSYNGVGIDDLIVAQEGDFEERKRRIREGLGLTNFPTPEIGIGIDATNLVYDLIFKELDKYERNLPLDSLNRVWYIRPWANDSFGLVGWFHIYYMDKKDKNDKNYFEIIDIAYDALKDSGWMNWTEKRNILLHPFLYPFAAGFKLNENLKNFGKLLGMKKKIGGFDVSDSDKISPLAAAMINKLDLIMVPSGWCRDAFIRSGVRSNIIQVLEHGLSNEMLVSLEESGDEKSENINNEIKMLRELKKGDGSGSGNILVLFFCVHSEWRKGADLVSEVMRRIQRKGGLMSKVTLVVKSGCDLAREYPGVRAVGIRGWLDNNDLRRLYDTCDILVSPSRGGGFELNALEGASRGLVTLVTNGGCFTDLMQYFIGVNVGRNVSPLPGNPIHVGMGPEVDINDFERKLEDAILRLDELRKVFRNRSKEIRERYTWKNTALKLEDYLRRYEFIR